MKKQNFLKAFGLMIRIIKETLQFSEKYEHEFHELLREKGIQIFEFCSQLQDINIADFLWSQVKQMLEENKK
jgi:hypothetical protein